jgi:DNA/RNA-binding domain of Phe-tRNA-synthetase-like protein
VNIILASDTWQKAYPDASLGILVLRNVSNPSGHVALDQRKVELENALRERFAGCDRSAIATLDPLPAYAAYYRRFKKTYHLQLQLESVALKCKPIPRVAGLVETMFMAELRNLALTAGHDLPTLSQPLTLDVATGEECYTTLSGKEQLLAPDDMYIADRTGIISSIMYGPDARTCIQPTTRDVIFTVYAVPGVAEDLVRRHLEDIRQFVMLVSPQAQVEALDVLRAH